MGTNGANADIKAMFKKSKPNPQKASQGSSEKSSVKKPSKLQSSSQTTSKPVNSSKSTSSNKSNQSKPLQMGDSQKKPFAKKSDPKANTKGGATDKKKTWNKDKVGGAPDKKKTWNKDKSGDKSWQKKRKAPPVQTAPKSKKELRAAKKAKNAERPHGAELLKANEVWHIFNDDVKKADRESKIGEILKELAGKLPPVCFKHDGSRAVQKMIKYGSVAQREQIYKELTGKMVDLSLDKHAHFVVIQLLKCDVEDIRKAVMQELMKKITKLTLHNTAGSVVDYMYASGKPKDRLRILAEFYGTEHALFAKLDDADTISTLAEVLAANPTKAPVILSSIQMHVDKCSTKDMFLFRPLHGLLAAYLPHAQPISKEQLISICSGKVLALHHSQEGAGLVCECLGQGTAKTRKAVIKGLKGRVHEVACNPYGHVILIRALQVIDDIVLLNSGILNELKEHVEDLLVDPSGAKVLLFIVNPELAGLSTDADRQMLAPALKDGEATSKKNPVVRRTEVFLKTITWLLPAIQTQLALISHNLACKVIFETIMHGYYVSDPSYASGEGKEVGAEDLKKLAAVRAPIMQTVEALAKMFSEEANVSLLEDPSIHYHLKRLFTKTQPSGKEIAGAFSKAFLPLVSQPTLSPAWLSNRGAFLLAFILETDNQLKAPLKAHIQEIKKVESAGTKLLVQVLEESAEERAKRLVTHKDEVEKSEAPTKALKKKKKKPKKRPAAPETQANHGEYKDAAIVGMKPKASKNIKVMSLLTADKEKKAQEKEEKKIVAEGKNVKIANEPTTKKAKTAEPEKTKVAQSEKKKQPVKAFEPEAAQEDEGDGYEGDEYGEYDEYDDAYGEGDDDEGDDGEDGN